MISRRFRSLAAGTVLALAVAHGPAASQPRATPDTMRLDRIAHVHGIAADPAHPGALYLATHFGLYRATPDGMARRVGGSKADLMSFTVNPTDPAIFYASGHPPRGGNLGFLESRDSGATWQRLSEGVGGPVDFHAMDVSRADPRLIFGMYKGLQASGDGGLTWRRAGDLPKKTFDIAASAMDARTVYAGAMDGLFISRDEGKSWTPALPHPRPTTMVHVAGGGRVYGFVYGVGLIAGAEPGTGWNIVSNRFGDRYLLHMAVDPADPKRLHAVADTGGILTSKDGGRSWVSYIGHDRETPELLAEGGKLFDEMCKSCHGDKGVGERPKDKYARDEYGFAAPALNDTAHGWHHSDDNLAETILKGSPRNPRMLPFKDLLSETDARNLVAYIRSLWSPRSLACQGARHMRCMH